MICISKRKSRLLVNKGTFKPSKDVMIMKHETILDIELEKLVKDLKSDMNHLRKTGIDPKAFLNGNLYEQYEKTLQKFKNTWSR